MTDFTDLFIFMTGAFAGALGMGLTFIGFAWIGRDHADQK